MTQKAPPSYKQFKASTYDGMAHGFMLGAGETYISAFGIFLGGTPLQIGVLAALPPFIGAIAQALSLKRLSRCKSRRRFIMDAALLQTFFFACIAVLPLLVGDYPHAVTILTLLSIAHASSGNFAAPAWSSLVGDMVPVKGRGAYFGFRNRRVGQSTFAGVILGGILLHYASTIGRSVEGFAVIFALAAVGRAVSVYWLGRYDDPPYEHNPREYFSFYQFIARIPRSNFARFVLFFSLINAAVALSSPFFSVYMLRELSFSYLTFTGLCATMAITQFLTMQHWGEISDRYGNKRILGLCGFGCALAPMLWLVSSHPLYLGCVQVFAGTVWAGFSLAASNFIFDAVTPQKRARCTAYQALMSSMFTLIGSVAGGLLLPQIPFSLAPLTEPHGVATPLLVIFLLSGIIRALTSAVLLPRFSEVRDVEHVKNREFIFRVVSFRPFAGATFSMIPWSSKRRRKS